MKRIGHKKAQQIQKRFLQVLRFFMALLFFCATARGQTVSTNFSFNEFLLVPVRVHLLSATHLPNLATTLTTNDIKRIFGKVNRVWAQAGVHFYLESVIKEDAAHQEFQSQLADFGDRFALESFRPEESQAKKMFHVYYIKSMQMNGICFPESIFVKDTAALRQVEGGIDEPLPRVTSHELGHALSLDHRQNTTNLMASGTSGFVLNESEIQQSRSSAQKLDWIESAPALLKKADELFRRKKFGEAKIFYSRLADISVKGKEVDLAKFRSQVSQTPRLLRSPKQQ